MTSDSCYNCNKKINEHTEEQKSECLAEVSDTASFLKSMLVSKKPEVESELSDNEVLDGFNDIKTGEAGRMSERWLHNSNSCHFFRKQSTKIKT